MTDEITLLLTESVNLLVVGMSVVFVFLTVLIGVVKLMSSLVQKFPEPVEPELVRQKSSTVESTKDISPDVVAAISAAIHQYRQK